METHHTIRQATDLLKEKGAIVGRATMAAVIALAMSVPLAPRGEAWATVTAADESVVFQTAASSDAQYDEGLADFMDYIGATQAAQLLRNPDWVDAPLNGNPDMSMASYTKLGASGDATSIDNLQQTMRWVRECNNKRAQEAREKGTSIPALRISPYLMAVSALQGNWTAAVAGRSHAGKFGVGENLAWGYPNPFDGWYTEEKKLFDSGVTDFGKIGHYKNVVNPGYTVTGYAICNSVRSYSGWGNVQQEQHEQSFSYSPVNGETTYTPDEFEQKFHEWRGGTPMYRLYNKWTQEHFYTASASERQTLIKRGWNDEQVGWYAPDKDRSQPVYRLYNPYDDDHHYTMGKAERDRMKKLGWRDEGIGWYSDPNQTVPLYREYNPWLRQGAHNYTPGKAEHDNLVKLGWKDEGIAWYGV